MTRLREQPSLEVGFLPINPRLPGAFRKLQSGQICFAQLVTSLHVPRNIAVASASLRRNPHISASYFSFVLAPTPAILISKLYGKKTVLNYHSGEAEDHLQRWRRSALPTIRLVD